MNRRDFLKKSVLAGVAGVGALKALEQVTFAANPVSSEVFVAQNGEPEALVAAGLKAFGGLSKIIKSGSSVVIKANFTWFGPPEQACDNNPDIVRSLVKACKDAGAKNVKVVDMTIDPSKMCMERSGIEKAVNDAGGEIMDLRKTPTMEAKSFTVYKIAQEADCLINLCILKNHSVTTMTSALKGLMGLTPEREVMHSYGIDTSLVDLAKDIHPHLHIIDAYRVLKTNGPRGPGDVIKPRQLILSHDPVAADTYAATVMGIPQPTHVKLAGKAGLGVADLKMIKITKVNA